MVGKVDILINIKNIRKKIDFFNCLKISIVLSYCLKEKMSDNRQQLSLLQGFLQEAIVELDRCVDLFSRYTKEKTELMQKVQWSERDTDTQIRMYLEQMALIDEKYRVEKIIADKTLYEEEVSVTYKQIEELVSELESANPS